MRQPWAFVAHRNGYWWGACSGAVDYSSLVDFLGGFTAAGFTITPASSRIHYMAILWGLRSCTESAAFLTAPQEFAAFPLFLEAPAEPWSIAA